MTVPIFKEHQKYLQFLCGAKKYQFRCLPFGLSSAPWAFTKLLKPVFAFLRNKGIRLIIYLDDILILSSSEARAQKDSPLKLKCLQIQVS